jgi:hypothetical protein
MAILSRSRLTRTIAAAALVVGFGTAIVASPAAHAQNWNHGGYGRGGYGGGYGGGWHGGGWGAGPAIVGGLLGAVAGAAIIGSLAPPVYYSAPQPYYPPAPGY